MRLAISNIAWESSENEAVLPLLRRYRVEGIELAPTKRWENPDVASPEEIAAYHSYWNKHGLVPVAMQSLLFNRPQLTVFGPTRTQTREYLGSIIRLAAGLSAKALVFGSPKARLIGEDPNGSKYEEAVDWFRMIGEEAARRGVVMCIEPNPSDYGCDFITTTEEGLQFVKDVGHDGLRLHLDTGTMLLNGEDAASLLPNCLPYAGHFHISNPFLTIPGTDGFSHEAIAEALRSLNYAGWVSIEMKGGNRDSDITALTEALDYVDRVYRRNGMS